MDALLLCAGLGTRLRPLTDHTPKCLVEIRGRPLLDIWIELLVRDGFDRILINTHHLPEAVRSFVSKHPEGARLTLVHEPSLLGTGGTIKANRNWFQSDPVLVAHGDNLTVFNAGEFVAAHRRRPTGTLLTMMTFEAEDPSSCGIVECNGDGLVVGFHEKVAHPPGRLANAAVYLMDRSLIEAIAARPASVIDLSTEVLPGLMGRMQTFANDRYHRDIGTPESLARAQREFPS